MSAPQSARAPSKAPRPRTLPAGARALIELRDAGRHPAFVVIVMGRRFATRRYVALAARLAAPPPLMALADEIEARALSWWVVRGLAVVLCNADGTRARQIVLCEAIAQIAREAAPVLMYGDRARPDELGDAVELLQLARFDHVQGCWPAGWNDRAHADYQARADRWYDEAAR